MERLSYLRPQNAMGMIALFAALDTATGRVIAKCDRWPRSLQLLNLVKKIDKGVQAELDRHWALGKLRYAERSTVTAEEASSVLHACRRLPAESLEVWFASAQDRRSSGRIRTSRWLRLGNTSERSWVNGAIRTAPCSLGLICYN